MLRLVAAVCALAVVFSTAGCGSGGEKAQETAVPDVAALADSAEFQPFDEPPVLVHFENPEYPEAARRAGIEGSAMVRIVVDTDGSVVDASVLESTNEDFAASALEAARSCRFEPGRLDGEPVRCAVAVPFKYAL